MHIWIWIWWVSTHLCISYHVSTCSLIWVLLRLFWCPFSALTSFLCLPVLVSVSPIPPALPLYNDCPFFLISKPFTRSQCSWCSFSTLTPSMMFLSPVFNPNFLPLAHPLYNQCLFYHVSTLFLNSNPLWWWCPFSVLAPSLLFVFNPDIWVWCLDCDALRVSENLLSCRQLTTVSSGI